MYISWDVPIRISRHRRLPRSTERARHFNCIPEPVKHKLLCQDLIQTWSPYSILERTKLIKKKLKCKLSTHTLSEAFTSITESACEQDRLFTASLSTNQSASWASGQLLVAWLQTWWTPSLTRWFGWMKPLIRLCKWEQKVGQKSTLSSSIQKTIDNPMRRKWYFCNLKWVFISFN